MIYKVVFIYFDGLEMEDSLEFNAEEEAIRYAEYVCDSVKNGTTKICATNPKRFPNMNSLSFGILMKKKKLSTR